MRLLSSLLLSAAAILSTPSLSLAGPLSLAWDDCYNNGAGGSVNKMWACDSNTGDAFRLYASAQPPPGITRFLGTLCTFDLQAASASFPDWWSFGPCRNVSALNADAVPGQTTCPDLEPLPQFTAYDYAIGSLGPNYARLRVLNVIDTSLAHPLVSGVEQTVFRLSINRSRTIGPGAVCSRCTTPMCIEFKSVLFDQVNVGSGITVTSSGGQYFAMWQGPGRFPCVAATPSTAPTWGRLKSLYR